jgi:large subunit ribosomal protein L53
MKTTYLTHLTLAYNPFLRTSKVPRLFLTMLSPSAHKAIQIKSTQYPRTSTQPAFLELTFKDGKKTRYEWRIEEYEEGKDKSRIVKLEDVVYEVERHARIAGRREDLAG